MQKVISFVLWSASLGVLVSLATASQADSARTTEPQSACEALSAIKTMNSVVTATYIATREDFARSTLQSTGEEPRALFKDATGQILEAPVPFCRVEITSTPVAGADIKSEVWLPPADQWNGRFLGAGNGGPAGVIYPEHLAGGLSQGYAIAQSDAGSHSRTRIGEGGRPIGMRFGAVNKEWATNYAHRGYHTMTVVAKEVTETFYTRKPKASLFMGCSGGGYEAIGEAWRYPEDYDGIIAGAPAIHFGQVGIWQGASYVATHHDPEAVIKSEMLPLIYNHYMAKCDALDGVKDGVIDHPPQCKVDFAPLQCHGGSTQDCFTAKQIAALNTLYAPLHHPVMNNIIYPGFPIGAELAFGAKVRLANESVGSEINPNTPGALVWVLPRGFSAKDWFSFDFAKDTDKYLAAFAPYENGNPNLRAFAARGGKFILFTGWADPNLNPYDILHYHENVKKAVGEEKAKAFTRLFMVPGMYHCGGGPGPNVFGQSMGGRGESEKSDASNDILAALDRWVIEGVAPERLIATKYVDDDPAKGVLRTRPLCAYPQVAKYIGRGDKTQAQNFTCGMPDVPDRLARK